VGFVVSFTFSIPINKHIFNDQDGLLLDLLMPNVINHVHLHSHKCSMVGVLLQMIISYTNMKHMNIFLFLLLHTLNEMAIIYELGYAYDVNEKEEKEN
jgi:hypothetical protein